MDELHARYQQQAEWTESLRRYIFERLDLGPSARVLEVGCGTGAVLQTLFGYTQAIALGVDIDLPSLRFARRNLPQAAFSAGDAHSLPFAAAAFDAVMCHFLLLWVANPLKVVREMARVCRPGGAVIALAEPDYGGRIDFPAALAEAGQMQANALQARGADPLAGRKLSGWMHAAGLAAVETGVLGGQWRGPASPQAHQSEWETLARDLSGRISPGRLEDLKRMDQAAWQVGSRVLFVPTFYAIGTKK